ncbi:MAG TPA: PEGA domain-containing protein [Gemmataceae bacterium]|jgi:hypothetical protein|nr:PEGA domain-containing protein [Gemmataceae bacterium]
MVRRAACVLIAVMAAFLSGCVERRFRIETNPPGAYVSINNTPIGPSPADVQFLYYGDYEIELKKEGFETKRIKQPVRAPLWAYPPVDFVVENLAPFKISDIRVLCYELDPVIVPNLDQFKAEGESYRQRAAGLPPPRFPEPPPKDKKDAPPKSDAILPAPKPMIVPPL